MMTFLKNTLKQLRFSGYMLAMVVMFSLFCPLVFSETWSASSPDLVLVNLFAAVYVAVVVLQRRVSIARDRVLAAALAALLLGFNIFSFYVNWTQHDWYYGQINVTISFLLFLALLTTPADGEKRINGSLLIAASVVSNALGFIPYFKNYYGLSIMNGQLALMYMKGQFDERRYHWFYFHKSEYSFMLILFLAVIVVYRRRFPKKWMYYGSVAVMLIGLVIANTRASMVAALAIFAGLLLDEIRRKPREVRKRYVAVLVILGLAAVGMLAVIAQRRNLLTLGSRTYIWSGGIQEILKNPMGLGRQCGEITYSIPAWPWNVANCHNVFLNILLQFSIPAGGCYLLMLAAILAASIKRNPSFLTLGIWVSMLIPLNMDWCLLLPQMSIFLTALYFLFFHPGRQEP